MASMSLHPKADTKVEADVHSSLNGKVCFTINTDDGTVDIFLTPYQAQQLIDTAQLTLNETKKHGHVHAGCGLDCTR